MTGIVLSGGGVRGIAHLGLLQFLQEAGIRPAAISGVSAGAIIGALYCAGHEPGRILGILKKNSYFGWSGFSFNKDGFFSMRPLQNSLKEYIKNDSFESLQIPLFVTVTDFTNNRSLTFSTGDLFQPVIASCAVPVIFEPVVWNNDMLIDGGLLNNFPVEAIESICDKIIGCHVNGIQPGKFSKKRQGKINILEKCFHMAIASRIATNAAKCNVFIEPGLHDFAMFDVSKADMIYEIGYKTALKYKNELLALLV